MKEPYEKPKMLTEKVEVGMLAAAGSPVGFDPGMTPIPQLQPFLGLCC